MSAPVPTYTYTKTGPSWIFMSKYPNVELPHPVLLSKLLANVSESNKRTFAYRNLDEDLIVDCDLDRESAISLAARRIVVLQTASLAAPFIRTESINPVLCFGLLKYNELGNNNAKWIGSHTVMGYIPCKTIKTGIAFGCSKEWNEAIDEAHRDAGVTLDLAEAGEAISKEYDRLVEEYRKSKT